MIPILTAATSLKLKLNAAPATNQLYFVAGWAQNGTGSHIEEQNTGISNGTSAVTVVAGPSTGFTRILQFLAIRNRDTAAAIIILQHDDGTAREVFQATLAVGDQLIVSGENWCVFDSSGQLKTSGTGTGGGSLTVEEEDGSPSYTDVTTLQFDQDAFVVTQPSANKALVSLLSTAMAANYDGFIDLAEQQAQNTAGGTFTSGSWQKRPINTEVLDSGGDCTLASNQITLEAGTYDIVARCPAWSVGNHQARLQNVTAGTTLLTGSCCSELVGSAQIDSWIIGRFTVAAGQTLEIQDQSLSTRATDGFGTPTNYTTEVYAQVRICKVSSGGGGGGTVTSVAISGPSIISWSGTPITSSGTLTGTMANQSANQVLAGPASGGAAAAAFRALVAADLGLTTKGDLLTFSTVLARLGVGSNGQVLTADSAEATGIKWAAGGGGTEATQAEMEAATGSTQMVTPRRVIAHPGVPKQMAMWTVSGTTPTIQTSVGGPSIARNGTGDYTLTFGTAFSSANYDYQISCEQTSGNSVAWIAVKYNTRATTSITIVTFNYAGTAIDMPSYTITCWGDQA